jgi:hypothetical protein
MYSAISQSSLYLQRICVLVEEIRPRLSVIISDDLGPSFPELVALLRIQIVLGPVGYLEVMVVGILVVDEELWLTIPGIVPKR